MNFCGISFRDQARFDIMDIVLPDTTGVEIAKRLKTEHPNIKIIMLSSEVTHELIHELLDIGVDGYLSKLAQTEHIRNAVLSVMNGTPYYGRSVMRVMYDMCVTHQHNILKSAAAIKECNNITLLLLKTIT